MLKKIDIQEPLISVLTSVNENENKEIKKLNDDLDQEENNIPRITKQDSLKWYTINKIVDVITSNPDKNLAGVDGVENFITVLKEYLAKNVTSLSRANNEAFRDYVVQFLKEKHNEAFPKWFKDSFDLYSQRKEEYFSQLEIRRDEIIKLGKIPPTFLEEKMLFDIFIDSKKSQLEFVDECEELGCRVRRSEYYKVEGGRNTFENKVLKLFTKSTKKYASFASGFLNQDLTIIEQAFARSGIIPEEFHFIDPIYAPTKKFFADKGYKAVPFDGEKYLDDFIIINFNKKERFSNKIDIQKFTDEIRAFCAVCQFSKYINNYSKKYNNIRKSSVYIHKYADDVIKKHLKFDLLLTYDIYDKETPYTKTEYPLGDEFRKLRRHSLTHNGKWCSGIKYGEGIEYKFFDKPTSEILHSDTKKIEKTKKGVFYEL